MKLQSRTSYAHRGYLIRHNPLSNVWWIEKDGFQISSCLDLEDGRRIIDTVLT